MGYLEDHGLDGFEREEGNSYKSWLKHRVSNAEAEQVFSNRPFFVSRDTTHSANEERRRIIGKTNAGKAVFISFTHRGSKVRVISSRWMGRKERERFNERTKGNPQL